MIMKAFRKWLLLHFLYALFFPAKRLPPTVHPFDSNQAQGRAQQQQESYFANKPPLGRRGAAPTRGRLRNWLCRNHGRLG